MKPLKKPIKPKKTKKKQKTIEETKKPIILSLGTTQDWRAPAQPTCLWCQDSKWLVYWFLQWFFGLFWFFLVLLVSSMVSWCFCTFYWFLEGFFGIHVDWLGGWLAGWLASWLAGWLAAWLACSLDGWLPGCLAAWLTGWQTCLGSSREVWLVSSWKQLPGSFPFNFELRFDQEMRGKWPMNLQQHFMDF